MNLQPLFRLPLFLLVSLVLPALADEIYFGTTTPLAVSSAQAPIATSQDNQIKLRGVVGGGLDKASSPSGIILAEAAISPTTASPMGYTPAMNGVPRRNGNGSVSLL